MQKTINQNDLDLLLKSGDEAKINKQIDLLRSKLGILKRLHAGLPEAIQKLLTAKSGKVKAALYHVDLENNIETYMAGSSNMMWSVDEPVEALYDRMAMTYVKEPGRYTIKLLFSAIDPQIPDIEIPANLEPPIKTAEEPKPAASEKNDQLADAINAMTMLITQIKESNDEAIERMEGKIEELKASQPPAEDPVMKMMMEQNKNLMDILSRNNSAKPDNPSSMGDMMNSLERMLTLTSKTRELAGGVQATVGGVTDGFSAMMETMEKVSKFKSMYENILGGKIEKEIDAGAAEIVSQKRSWGDVFMGFVDRFGNQAIPTISTMLGRAVQAAAAREINEIAGQHARATAPKPNVTVRSASKPATPVRTPPPPAAQKPEVMPAKPNPDQEKQDNVIPFPNAGESPADFREIKLGEPEPPAEDPPAAPAQSWDELFNEMESDFSAPEFSVRTDDGTYANYVADSLDIILPGWYGAYAGRPLNDVATEIKGLCYAQRPGLKMHDDKMDDLISDLLDIANSMGD